MDIPPPPPGFTMDTQGPVYGAPPSADTPYKGPQAQANLTRTQQEIKQAEATAAATTTKTKAEAQSALIAAKTAQETYDQAHVAESPALVGLTGHALLSKLPADEAPMIKAMIDGRMAPPTASALKDPQWQQRLKWANQVDPDFNEARWQMRVKTMGDAATGRLAQANNAINTAIGHAGLLMDQASGSGVAGHGNWPLVPDAIPTAFNAIENAANTGNPSLSAYKDTAVKLGTEEARAYQGGAPNEGDTNRFVASLSANLPYDAKKAVIHNALDLFASKITANLAQYDFGTTGGKPPLNVLDKPALDALKKYAPDVLDKYFYAGTIGGNSHDDTAPPGGPSGGSPAQPPPPTMPPDQMAPATGQTKDVIDPAMTPVRQGYLARLQAGQSGAQLVSFLRQSGVTNPGLLNSAVAQAAFRRKYPDVPIGRYGTDQIDHTTVQMGMVNRAVNAIGQTGVGAGAIAAGNAVLGGYGPDMIGALGGNEAQARLAGQYSAQNHPGAALTGEIAGGTLATMGGEAALARGAGMAPGVVRSLVANSLYGGIAGSGATPDNRLGGAAMGAAAGAGGSLLGEGAARVGSKVLGGLAGTDASALLNSGVPLTIGQAVGGAAKSLEDKAMSYVPGIAARRAEGIRVFNAKAINKALEPIGATGSGKTGDEGIADAQAAVKGAFDTALKGKVAVPDKPFIDEARGALGRLATIRRNDLGSEIVGQIEGATKDLFDPSTGALSGENMQTFLESMRQIRQAYRNDPLSQRVITPSIRQIEKATEDMFGRQAPEVVPAFNAAKTAYRRVSVLADAVNSAENTNGVYTAAQLGQAARANAKKYDGAMSAAANRSDLRQFQREAQNVLPSTIPDSGTAGRAALAAVPAALAGGAGGYELGGHNGAATGIGIVGALSLLYSRRGQSALIGAAVKRDGVDRAIARALDKYRALGAAAGGATGVSTTASPQGAIPYP